MPKIVLKDQFFTRDGDGNRNYLVNEDWGTLNNLPSGTRVWITAARAIALTDELPSVFYGLVNSGKIDSHFIKPNNESYKGYYIVRLDQVTEYGVKEFERKAKKELPALINKLRKMGVEESLIQAMTEQHEAATNKATQQLRDGLEILIKGKGMLRESAVA